MVCCPEPLPESAICFPSDPWCRTYEAPDYSDYEYEVCLSEKTADILEEDQAEDTAEQYDFQEFDTEVNNNGSPSRATV